MLISHFVTLVSGSFNLLEMLTLYVMDQKGKIIFNVKFYTFSVLENLTE